MFQGRIDGQTVRLTIGVTVAWNIDQARAWLEGEAAARATQARQAFGSLRTFLPWREDRPECRGLASPDAFATWLARQGLPKKGAKGDVLGREQLPAWFTAMRSLGNPVIAAHLQALLLTGAGHEELATLTWYKPGLPVGKLDHPQQGGGRAHHPVDPLGRLPTDRPPASQLPNGRLRPPVPEWSDPGR